MSFTDPVYFAVTFSASSRTQCWIQFKLQLLLVSAVCHYTSNSPTRDLVCIQMSLSPSVNCSLCFFTLPSLNSWSIHISLNPLLSHRGNREEAHSLQERKQVLADAHLLSGDEGQTQTHWVILFSFCYCRFYFGYLESLIRYIWLFHE